MFRWSGDGAGALAAVKVVNATAMALTALPAYALARRVVPRGWALGVAALSVLVPWTVYSALTMTESLFYPVFVAYAAVLAWTLERPSAARQAALLGSLAVLVGVRAQGLTVALGTVAAILVCGALDGSVAAMLRRFRLTLGLFALGLGLGLVAAVAGVAVPTSSYIVRLRLHLPGSAACSNGERGRSGHSSLRSGSLRSRPFRSLCGGCCGGARHPRRVRPGPPR